MAEQQILVRYVSFGEAMIRFAPVGDKEQWHGVPSAVSQYTRSVGGDELNVCVDLAKLGCDTSWVSVLPSGPLGGVVNACADEAGVHLDHLVVDEGGSMGTFHIFPEEGVTHFERRHSSFCTQSPNVFNWPTILAERGRGGAHVWMHQSGITPMLGENARNSWVASIEAAAAAETPVSLDLNHRPQLGTLAALWAIVEPQLKHICLLILSVDQTVKLAELLAVAPGKVAGQVQAGGVYTEEDGVMDSVPDLVAAIHAKLNGPAVVCVLKTRDAEKRQRRWSVLRDGAGTHSTAEAPTEHVPQDECGGGSAWAAGVVHRLSQDLAASGRRLPRQEDGRVVLEAAPEALRRGDILAALAQETVGDHSCATLEDLKHVEQRFHGKLASVSGLPVSSGTSGVAPAAEAHVEVRLKQALERLDKAKVIAILRTKCEARALDRAKELADMGYRAIEVTADSAGFNEGTLMPALVASVGDRVLVGCGTITRLAQLELAARGGAHFALSPVCPTVGWEGTAGFVQECHKRGVLAMPAAFTPQEIYQCVDGYGALTVKIFPAQLWNPAALKDLRRIGDYGKMRLCPSGGINCANAQAWLEAGAVAVGMGGSLTGRDIATDPSDKDAMAAAEKEWLSKSKPEAVSLAKKLGLAAA